jgi:hypothetical protein
MKLQFKYNKGHTQEHPIQFMSNQQHHSFSTPPEFHLHSKEFLKVIWTKSIPPNPMRLSTLIRRSACHKLQSVSL